jgi:hypothetical protein
MIVALMLGGCASWINFHTDEPLVLCAFVMLLAAGCGAAFPARRSWLCGIVIGGSISIYYLIGYRVGFRPHWPRSQWAPVDWATAITIIPSTIGIAAGAAARKVSELVFTASFPGNNN